MIYAYDKIYLDNAQNMLGAMFHYAVYDCKCSIADFYMKFISSSLSQRFSRGDLFVIAGKSGVEIAIEVLGIEDSFVEPSYYGGRSKEYWTGWALGYYQWYTGRSFREIQEEISIEQLMGMYNPYHEMDIMKLVDKIKEMNADRRFVSYLKKYRILAGLSQRELSERTDIPIKTIQQYEQKRKDINKAQVEYVVKLSRALCCGVEDLIE